MSNNKIKFIVFSLMLLAIFCISSCSVVKGIFDAGMVWGIFLIIAVIGLIVYLVSRIGKNK
ncbi:MAG: hypothetical protein ACXVPN_04145 [Bacteroidia bacterium]